ncbi:alpha-D-ribose 1-methylphosphonate 5-triphosphate diphosphatase [Rhodospirillaceae bacterium SYSU D60014]|uniref:alpha-D-ribose 1-methylphosphonate 5-triphosphate diphosphatase n=1 Tax=Virgifigura deserti TaxID=2268457 RepID=UPI000E65FF6D
MRRVLQSDRVLWPDGSLAEGSVVIEDGVFAPDTAAGAAAASGDRTIRADGFVLLPGIVDLHGDAFERQIMPRPGVAVRLDLALTETDRQLVANGITTAFHGVTNSWEPGLRSRDAFLRLADALAGLDGALACDTRLHLRFETFNLDAVEEMEQWIAGGRIGILAFNDHTPEIHRARSDPGKVRKYAERAGLPGEEFRLLVEHVYARRDAVPAAVERLAAAARTHAIGLMSHDDDSPALRRHYHGLGCRIAEFPKNAETAEAARALGDAIVMGAPNVLRGGSHNGAVCATSMIEAGLCTILASDYYYPAPFHAAFRLTRDGRASLGEAWRLVSINPARAAGLDDRGEIAVGQRADFLLVDVSRPELPRVAATFTAGRPVHIADSTVARMLEP